MFTNTPDLFTIAELKPVWSVKPLPYRSRIKITSSRDIHSLFFHHYPELDLYESFWVMLLSRSNTFLGIRHISTGGVAGTVADPKKIFQSALLANASSIVLMHNHPSGNTQPSALDREITNKCKLTGHYLNLPVLDHVIFCPDGNYLSFADEGLL